MSSCPRWFPQRGRARASAMLAVLDRSIDHCGNSEWTHRFAIRLGYIDASQGLRLITPTFQGMYCLSLFFRCFPDFLVHTWGFLTLVFRHSSNGESFAAVGVGQQTLQGFHLVPSTRLRCLHDTHLESANVAVNGRPVNGIPLCRFAGEGTNGV